MACLSCGGCGPRADITEADDDPEEDDGQASWRYVGDGKGAYEQVNDLTYPVVPDIDPEANRIGPGVRPRICLLSLLIVGTAAGAVLSKMPHRLAAPPAAPGAAVEHVSIEGSRRSAADGAAARRLPYHCVLSPQHALLADAANRPSLGAVLGMRLVEAAWNIADGDGDGTVQRKNVHAAKAAGQFSAEVADLLWPDGRGAMESIGHDRFVAALMGQGVADGALDRQRLFDGYTRAAWLLLDANGDGRLSRQELETVKWYPKLPGEAPQALSEADADGGGTLSREEFFAALRPPVGGSAADSTDLVATAMAAEIESWTTEKRAWCCDEAGVGCAAESAMPGLGTLPGSRGSEGTTTTRLRFDCEVGYGDWGSLWSVHKQLWCCEHYGRGCSKAAEAATSAPYDCSHQYGTWEHSWSLGKRDWCCKHSGRGCTGERRVPSPEARAEAASIAAAARTILEPSKVGFNCHSADVGNFLQAWSLRKQAWCCARENVACTSV